MKSLLLKKVLPGAYLHRYDAVYQTESGREKVYELVSRDGSLKSVQELHARGSDAVIMLLTDEDNARIVLLREFRMTAGEFVYNFPAGLLNPGESVEQAAARELREETGLELAAIDKIFRPGYSALGVSNEKNTFLLGKARGEIRPSDSDEEELLAAWYTREEIPALIDSEPFETRTQLMCWLWSQGKI